MGDRFRFYWAKLKGALLGSRSHEFLVFLFFLVVSFSFWFLQTLNETFETELQFPLTLEGVPENVLITTELPREVSATVRGRGTSLVSFFRRRLREPVVVDFSKYDNGTISGRVQVPLSDVQRALQTRMDATTHVQAIRPDTLEYFYNRGQYRALPVNVCGEVSTSPQNYLLHLSVEPDSVIVYASASVLDTMTAAFTQMLEMKDLTRTTVQSVPLISMRGVRYEPAQVKVTAQVDYYTEKTVEVPIIGLNFPADKQLRTFPARAKITFRVGSARFHQLTEENFVLAVTYEELLNNDQPKLRLHLKSLPDGVANVRISPQEVDYLIELSDGEGGNPA